MKGIGERAGNCSLEEIVMLLRTRTDEHGIDTALVAGAQALQRPIGVIASGARADIVVLDESHADLAARSGDQWLDAWIFTAGRAAVKTVLVGGETVVEAGRHTARAAIEAHYRAAVAGITT